MNVDSRYQVGEFSAVNKRFVCPDRFLPGQTRNVIDDQVLGIANNDTSEHAIGVTYECTASDIGGARIFCQFEDKGWQYIIDLSETNICIIGNYSVNRWFRPVNRHVPRVQ